ncbi:hypothetical protein [Hydrogenovibrio kuenenii]|uniref:hypothetical protein n=1 Tax=Hydrogenovibrio kuenenii TaxID=63658 RepID=UPI0004664DF4|nr:hypothetical protein [Hydrogenovibrio kuenenii]
MPILGNSVWNAKNVLGLEDGLYRVISVVFQTKEIILFPIINQTAEIKPLCVPLDFFEEAITDKSIIKFDFELPSFMQKADSEISEKELKKRNHNLYLISGLIEDSQFIYEYAKNKKISRLAEHATKVGTYRKRLARLLTLYWKFGQSSNALLPFYQNSGAPGKPKIAKSSTLGAPKSTRTLAVTTSEKYVLQPVDKKNIKSYLKKHFLIVNGPALKKVYEDFLKKHHSEELKLAKLKGRVPLVPSFRQFSYWKRQFFTKDEIIRKRNSEHHINLKSRAVIGSVKDEWKVPGSCFELDATVADVHIVSSFRANAVLGRPTIYSIVDRASGMIVGLNVSLFHASWRAARLALANAFLPKAEYCKSFDVDIVDAEWPCHHAPLRLMCDNGEMIGLQPQQTIVPFTELQFAPPYRGDFKSMVERRFGLLNSKVIHQLLGTTRGRQVVRGDENPKSRAVYTLKEFTKELILAVLELNKTIYDSLATIDDALIRNDLAPTPLNFWKIHLKNHQHALKKANREDVIGQLYPADKASVTRNGIFYNDIYYGCDKLIENNLASIARVNGRWTVEARVNENTADYIYVRFDKTSSFVRCDLTKRSSMYAGNSLIDADFVQDWLKDKKAKHIAENLDSNFDSNRSIQEAVGKKRLKRDGKRKLVDSSGIRQNREDELKKTVHQVSEVKDMPTPEKAMDDERSNDRVVYLPRRKKK